MTNKPSNPLEKGTGSELTCINTGEKGCCEVPVPLFQRAASNCMIGILAVGILCVSGTVAKAETKPSHTFAFGGDRGEQFLLDGKPFQMIGGEMHPGRVPQEYWRHRIRMAKAMGLNTMPIYVFWNQHEREEGKYDFATGSRNIGRFLEIAKEEGLWVVLRPGPYCCGEWDFGGIPTYLLRFPDLKLRTMADARYTQAVERYFHELARVVRPHLVANGGPILMVQIENEYGSYQRRDHSYMVWLRDLWVKEGVPGPFCTGDGPGENFLKDVVIPGVAVGLDSGTNEKDWDVARKMNPGVPVFSAETYPGWLRHWGEGNWSPNNVSGLIKFYMDNKKSFSLYMFHGGTNFGFTAGANHDGPGGYQPDVTSYDYASPLDEQGRPTPAYHAIRKQLASYLPPGEALPAIPAPIPTIQLPKITLERWTSVWNQMPTSVESENPASFESLGQNQGLMIYRTTLPAGAKGTLSFEKVHDYAQVFVDGKFLGVLDRCKGQRKTEIPDVGGRKAVLEVLVEGMGHINYNIAMEQDRKGILGSVKLGDAMLTHWQMFAFPLQEQWVEALPKTLATASRPGGIFKAKFTLDTVADTFIDASKYSKGVIWVNGHNLGRYWSIGPQKQLYCPASWLKKGVNEMIVLDLNMTEAGKE
jgi:beta-galactosidase